MPWSIFTWKIKTMTERTYRRIGVFTSGGDSPGMNACIRAVVRSAFSNGLEVTGIESGFEGMIAGNMRVLSSQSVSNIIQRGGTILKSARSAEFMTSSGRIKAAEQLAKHGIDALIAIGGDGTFSGLLQFQDEFGIPSIGIPGTIDNDLAGTDFTIGFDSAVNTAVEAIDKIRDTADSHNRLFFIEVMGRDTGFIALYAGIAGGVEAILLPESTTSIDDLIAALDRGKQKGKTSSIVVISEGDDAGDAVQIAQAVKKKYDHYDTRTVVLGHLQRGGSPSARDRVLAQQLGVAAVELLLQGANKHMVGVINGQVASAPLDTIVGTKKGIHPHLMNQPEIYIS